MLPLLPQSTAPVPNTQHDVLEEGGALQADDSTIVRSHTCFAVIWVLFTLKHMQA